MKDLDAVVISTPDHWHALQTIAACEAGRDIYVEKPLSLGVVEGRRMVEAVRQHHRVCQVGIHRRSSPFCREVAEYIRGGGLGHVSVIRAFHVQNEWPKGIGNPPDEPAPADLDWEQWLGPAPKVPYSQNRTRYRFRWFYGYSGGQLTNMGVHYLDLVHWAVGHDAPLAVTALGGKFAIEDNREIPDTLEALWTYPGGTLVTFSQINANGAPAAMRNCELEVRGTKGTLYFQGNTAEVVPEVVTEKEFPVRSPLDRAGDRAWREGARPCIEPKSMKGDSDTARHARNFLDCVKSRARCNCDAETGHRSTTATLIANIALRAEALLAWDGKAEKFANQPAANRWLEPAYRAPYRLPGV